MHPGEAPATAPRRALRAAGRGGLRGAVPSRAAERTPDEGGHQRSSEGGAVPSRAAERTPDEGGNQRSSEGGAVPSRAAERTPDEGGNQRSSEGGAVPSRAAERTPDEGGNQHAIRRCSRADSYRDTTMRGVIRGHQTPSGAIRGTRLPRHDDEGDPLACLGLVVRVDLLTVARDLSARGSALLRLVRAQAHLMRGAISMQSLYPTCTCPGAPDEGGNQHAITLSDLHLPRSTYAHWRKWLAISGGNQRSPSVAISGGNQRWQSFAISRGHPW